MMYFFLYFPLFFLATAGHIPLLPRVDPCTQEVQDNEVETLDGPTYDSTAGIGAEFESPAFEFSKYGCSKEDTDAAKRQIVQARSGLNYMLTADSGPQQGKLHAEYILDGRFIKVGSGDAARAGAAIAEDVRAWQPWNGPEASNIIIGDNKCNPWSVTQPRNGDSADGIEWDPQITAAMPLEAVYALMKDAVAEREPHNILIGITPFVGNDDGGDLILVTQDFFKSSPNGILANTVTDDVLGFCTVVLSYVKGARYINPGVQSPKQLTTFMPRTELKTIYQQVRSKLPGDLFSLFNVLACYLYDKENDEGVRIDDYYCSGSVLNPRPNGKINDLSYSNTNGKVMIKAWIQGMSDGTSSPDLLSAYDATIDGSLGGLGTQLEKMYQSERSVPLFEFRDLYPLPKTPEIEKFMADVDTAIQALHKTYANPPQRKKRQAPASCALTAATPLQSSVPASITPAPTLSCVLHHPQPGQGISQAFCLCNNSITLSPLPIMSVADESCAYKSMPGSSAIEVVGVQTEIWTANCQACTIIGGTADQKTCTLVAGCTPTNAITSTGAAAQSSAATPTIAAWVGNLSTIDIGNAEDGNGGRTLQKEMFTKLKAMCSSSGCKSDHAVMEDVEAIIVGGEEPLKPAMYLQGAQFTSQAVFEMMLATGISTWIAALNNPTLELCKNVTYEADADPTGKGCGKGPIETKKLRRKRRADNGELLWEREGLAFEERKLAERCGNDCSTHQLHCHYHARMCSAPNEITVVMATKSDPYANHLNIGVTLDSLGGGFSCLALVTELTAAVILLAPELLPEEAFEGIELEALCGFIDHPETILGNITTWLTGRDEPMVLLG